MLSSHKTSTSLYKICAELLKQFNYCCSKMNTMSGLVLRVLVLLCLVLLSLVLFGQI